MLISAILYVQKFVIKKSYGTVCKTEVGRQKDSTGMSSKYGWYNLQIFASKLNWIPRNPVAQEL